MTTALYALKRPNARADPPIIWHTYIMYAIDTHTDPSLAGPENQRPHNETEVPSKKNTCHLDGDRDPDFLGTCIAEFGARRTCIQWSDFRV